MNEREQTHNVEDSPEYKLGLEAGRKELASAQAKVVELREALTEAIQDICEWGAYASDYFQEKWDLKGCIEKHKQALASTDTDALRQQQGEPYGPDGESIREGFDEATSRPPATRELSNKEVDAKKLYSASIDNDPTIHCNRFPGWNELSKAEKDIWIAAAKEPK